MRNGHYVTVFQSGPRLQYVLFGMLNAYFIAQIAENTFILQWKKVKTGIADYPSLGEIKTKYKPLGFLIQHIFSNAEIS